VSDPVPPSDPRQPSGIVEPGVEVEVDLDVASFLPDGVMVAEPARIDADPVVDLEALDQVERDLDAVDAAIAAIDAGTYGVDPLTGAAIDDEVLAADPTRLR
jgi:RNA polymerase-binding transcription factor DksA